MKETGSGQISDALPASDWWGVKECAINSVRIASVRTDTNSGPPKCISRTCSSMVQSERVGGNQ